MTVAVEPGFSRSSNAELLFQLRQLDNLLKAAVERARLLFGVDENGAALRGVYIDEDEIDRLVNPGGVTLGVEALTAEVLCGFHSSSRILELSERFGFTDFDTGCLLLAVAPEIDLRYERIYGYLQDDVTKRKATVNLALNLLCTTPESRIEQRTRFSPDAPLLRSGLLKLHLDSSQPDAPLLAQYLHLDERAIRALIGDGRLDDRLSPFCELSTVFPKPPVIGEEIDIVHRLPAFANLTRSGGRPVRLLLAGDAGNAKRKAVEFLAEANGGVVLAADMEKYQHWRTEPIETALLLRRELMLSGAVLYASGLAVTTTDEGAAKAFISTLIDHPGITCLASDNPLIAAIAASQGFLSISFPLPTYEARHELWQQLTAEAGVIADDDTLATLANNFRLTADQIAVAVTTARQQLEWNITNSEEISGSEIRTELLAAARSQTGLELAALTSKLELRYSWPDIVLPDDTRELLQEICQRVRHSYDVLEHGGFAKKLSGGKGTSVLFAGASGTGKTMAAEIIAHDLGLDLFRIDLSSVVSKYIGETEKNLERIFNAAARSNSVLLFDEADALFGKRSIVNDAHDRYANVEISYLLQKMEQYDGITILTSNLRANIDEGFWRRLAFTVHFQFPEESTRREIWRKVWPEEIVLDEDVNLTELARRFRLSGGNIRNVALAASFLAAAKQRAVQMADILHATRREYAKVGKHLTNAELEDVVQ